MTDGQDRLFDGGQGEGDGRATRGPGRRGSRKGERRGGGGGPRTRAGKAKALGNLRSEDGGGNWRHGLHAWVDSGGAVAPPCKRCLFASRCGRFVEGATCGLAEEHLAEVMEEIAALPWVKAQDAFAVRVFGVTATALRIADQYIAAVGPFRVGEDGEVEVQASIMDWRHKLSGALGRQAEALGLTPTARARMGLEPRRPRGLAALLAEAAERSGGGEDGRG